MLVVRGDDGELRAFQNVCRHRGNPLCDGSGGGLTELRCGFHRWCWDLRGELREVPSRKGFGSLRNEDFPLLRVAVETWGPFVFVNLDPDAMPLVGVARGCARRHRVGRLEDFRCSAFVEVPVDANWKTAADGFSETYHLQGLHREMLPVVDDVDAPQRFWDRHGKSTQRYGVPSPRLGAGVTDQQVWDAFVKVMGTRVGIPTEADPGAAPEVPDGSTLSAVIAERVRTFQAGQGVDLGGFADDEIMCLQQYNLFPNITVLVYADLLQVLRARPGATPDEAFLDGFFFDRHAADDRSPRTQPMDVSISAGRGRLRHGPEPGLRDPAARPAGPAPAGHDAPAPLGRGGPHRQFPPQPRAHARRRRPLTREPPDGPAARCGRARACGSRCRAGCRTAAAR